MAENTEIKSRVTPGSSKSEGPAASSGMPPHKGGALRKWLSYLLKYAVPLFISVGLCWLLFKKMNFHEMMRIIREQCDFTWIFLGLAFNITAMIFRAFRWGLQLNALGVRPTRKELILAIFGTYAVNLVLPRLGELWRSGYIAQRQDKPFTIVFGSMLGDRLADTLTVLLLAFVTFLLASKAILMYFSENGETVARLHGFITSPWLWLTIGLIAVGLIIFMRLRTQTKWISRTQKAIHELWHGFAVLATMPRRGLWLILTVCIWGSYFMSFYMAFHSFGFNVASEEQYGVIVVLVTFVLSSISMGVPSNGGIGPWQWAVIFALGIYGVEGGNAGAFANVVLFSTTMMQIALGLFTFACIALDKKISHIKIKKKQCQK